MRERRNLPMIMPRCASAAKRAKWSWELERKNGNSERSGGEFRLMGQEPYFTASFGISKVFYFLEDDTDQFISGGDHVFCDAERCTKDRHPELFFA